MENGNMPALPTPIAISASGDVFNGEAGLTKREYFAGLAMQGFAADGNYEWPDGAKGMANDAVIWADVLLEALEK